MRCLSYVGLMHLYHPSVHMSSMTMTLTHKTDIHKIASVVGCYPEKMSRSGKENIIFWNVLLLPHASFDLQFLARLTSEIPWGKWPCVRFDLCSGYGVVVSTLWKQTFSPHIIAQAVLHHLGFECPDKYKLRVRPTSLCGIKLGTVSLWKKTTQFETSKSLADMRKKQNMYYPTKPRATGI